MSKNVPEQCLNVCPVANKDNLAETAIVFARNCPGPRIAGKLDENETYDLTPGTIVQPKLGEKICMNAGVYLSLEVRDEPVELKKVIEGRKAILRTLELLGKLGNKQDDKE